MIRKSDLREASEIGLKTREWLFADVVGMDEPVLLYAAAGVGKSRFALSMTLAAVRGDNWLGFRHGGSEVKALYVDGELSEVDYSNRLHAAGAYKDPKVKRKFDYLSRCEEVLRPEELVEFVKAQGYNFVVLDSLRTLFDVGEENAAEGVGKVLNALVKQLRDAGVFVVVVHHSRKSGGSGDRYNYSGSSNIMTTFSCLLELHEDGGDGVLRLSVDKSRSGHFIELDGLRVADEKGEWQVKRYVDPDHLAAAQDFVDRARRGEFRMSEDWQAWGESSWFGSRFGGKTKRLYQNVFADKYYIDEMADDTYPEFKKWLNAMKKKGQELANHKTRRWKEMEAHWSLPEFTRWSDGLGVKGEKGEVHSIMKYRLGKAYTGVELVGH